MKAIYEEIRAKWEFDGKAPTKIIFSWGLSPQSPNPSPFGLLGAGGSMMGDGWGRGLAPTKIRVHIRCKQPLALTSPRLIFSGKALL